MKNEAKAAACLVGSLFLLVGCGGDLRDINQTFTSRSWTHHVAFGTYSVPAGRRLVYAVYREGASAAEQQAPQPSGRSGYADICAEPPPDAVDAYADAVVSSAKGSASTYSGGATFGQARASSSVLGLYRSQGLQFLRDQQTSLCLDVIQGRITAKEYLEERRTIRMDAVGLIEKEMEALKVAASRQPVVVTGATLSDIRQQNDAAAHSAAR